MKFMSKDNFNQNLLLQGQKVAEKFKKEVQAANTSRALQDIKANYLGKQGFFSTLMKQLGSVSPEKKSEIGQGLNKSQKIIQNFYEEKKQTLENEELSARLVNEALDMSLSGPQYPQGSLHPVSLIEKRMVEIFSKLGFSVRLGPWKETEFFNFEALNIPKTHPARDMQDTFFLENGEVLRTHTSPVQIHVMQSEKPPFRVLAPGSVFRCDSDITHAPHFHQLEGLCCDTTTSMAELKGCLSFFIKEFLGVALKTRFRPSFFPFTEPSAEVDFECPLCRGKGCSTCSQSGWIEIGGCGLVHPAVFEHANVNSNFYKGFAFGLGIERLAMIYYDLNDIRLFSDNDLRFLKQFRNEEI